MLDLDPQADSLSQLKLRVMEGTPSRGHCSSAALNPSKTFWSPRFGMLTDRFGVGWMVSVAGQAA